MRLGYPGLGELVIGVVFGPLNMMGAAAAVTGAAFRPDMFILSIGIGCLVTNIVFVHSVMEAAADKQLGKRTFAHLLGGKTSQITALAVFTLEPLVPADPRLPAAVRLFPLLHLALHQQPPLRRHSPLVDGLDGKLE